MPSKVHRRMKRRKVVNRKSPTTKALSKRIRRIERDQELKHADSYGNALPLNTTGVDLYLCPTVQGLDVEQERIGDEIRATSVRFRFYVIPSTAALFTLAVIYYRVMMVWDSQCNGAAPLWTGSETTDSVLDTTIVTDPLLAPYNHQSSHRYKILYDKVFNLHPVVSSGTAFYYNTNYVAKKLQLGRIIKYASTNNGTVVDCISNSIHMWFYSDVAPGSNPPSLYFSSRLHYKDS